MDTENPTPAAEGEPHPRITEAGRDDSIASGDSAPTPPQADGIHWVFIGPQGLRAGWSILIFLALAFGIGEVLSRAVRATHLLPAPGSHAPFTPLTGGIGEAAQLLTIILAAWIVSRIERRRLSDYYLAGPGRVSRFFSGGVTGFAAVSLLVGGLAGGGWLHFGPQGLSGAQIAIYAVEWGGVFLLVGCFEEGLERCYLLYTMARGLNYWWSIGLVVALCILISLNPKASGLWGAYAIALLGVAPCLLLHLKKAPSAGFWNAAWVTSVMFGSGHTANPGENWIGIFAAAGIGFVFCASVKLTGSVWWAIGCHAAWDWGETYFYGTPDSGLVAKGHLMTAIVPQTANPVWSGGTDGPEGSLLVIPIMLVILLVLVVQYGRRSREDGQRMPAGQAAD